MPKNGNGNGKNNNNVVNVSVGYTFTIGSNYVKLNMGATKDYNKTKEEPEVIAEELLESLFVKLDKFSVELLNKIQQQIQHTDKELKIDKKVEKTYNTQKEEIEW